MIFSLAQGSPHLKTFTTLLQSGKDSVLLTPKAIEKITKLSSTEAAGKLVRLEVQGGGCSGFQYQFNLTSKVEDDDFVIESNGAKLVIDETSLAFIKGSTVDYKEELIRNAFVVVDNPNADSGCSCGASFMVKS